MAKQTAADRKLEDLKNQNCNIRDIKSEIIPGKIRYNKSDTRGYGLSDVFQQVVDNEFPYYAPEDPSDKDRIVTIDIQLQLGNQIAYIPAKSIINLELVESQDYLWYYGSMTILDANSFLMNSFRWRGTETLQLNFGHVKLFIPIKASVTSIDTIESHDKHSVFRINFAHPGWSQGRRYVPYSSPGPKRLSEAVKDVMDELGVDSRPIVESTENIGIYTNPGLDATDFLKHLSSFAISTRETASYSIFTSFTDWHFVSKDYFNRQAIFRNDFSFTDTPNYDQYSDIAQAPLILAQRMGPIQSFAGRADLGLLKGSAYDHKRGANADDTSLYDAAQSINNKSMLGKSYNDISIQGGKGSYYTGFRNPLDEKGYLASIAESEIEKTSTSEVVVRGHHALGGRGYMKPGVSVGLDITKGTEENKVNFFSSTWITNAVTHQITQKMGWRTVLSMYRNSY